MFFQKNFPPSDVTYHDQALTPRGGAFRVAVLHDRVLHGGGGFRVLDARDVGQRADAQPAGLFHARVLGDGRVLAERDHLLHDILVGLADAEGQSVEELSGAFSLEVLLLNLAFDVEHRGFGAGQSQNIKPEVPMVKKRIPDEIVNSINQSMGHMLKI